MNALILLRPSHWIKNLLVFVPIFFGGELYNLIKMRAGAITFIAFCLVASGGYAWNDIMDEKEDARDTYKKNRPLPLRAISRMRAGIIGLTASSAGIALATTYIPNALTSIGLYVATSAFYSLYAKRIPVIELLFFPAFYLMRVFAGGTATHIVLSNWLILCIIFIILCIIVIKRKAEADKQIYSREFLNHLIAIFGSSALMSYGLYSILGAQSPYAVYSIFFPLAGTMRYLMLTEKEEKGGYPEKTIIRDPFIAGSIVTWIIFMYILLYSP